MTETEREGARLRQAKKRRLGRAERIRLQAVQYASRFPRLEWQLQFLQSVGAQSVRAAGALVEVQRAAAFIPEGSGRDQYLKGHRINTKVSIRQLAKRFINRKIRQAQATVAGAGVDNDEDWRAYVEPGTLTGDLEHVAALLGDDTPPISDEGRLFSVLDRHLSGGKKAQGCG